ncbi:uncharacterized protein PGTG_22172 [Puccinia graminis f. sp. tritici CRL 75-36-700-3]|uniref:Uncharacterized protein n=1 Tax=Puccinia graminis f. sp. tritici (strain CRL 75-36-700-3 / race SCCL) TaxID=418459 RepID=H6QTP1_PUCGT|nr:uncharacterized protein PGTG_22172 [Puccinia graminis f. sp. tritici CRL 75-36-700-3]EHS64256.1 hypothetical protein PGTG_22172 [Puccinia graminis f. sp. tritici CRL 75-36-700-3]
MIPTSQPVPNGHKHVYKNLCPPMLYPSTPVPSTTTTSLLASLSQITSPPFTFQSTLLSTRWHFLFLIAS